MKSVPNCLECTEDAAMRTLSLLEISQEEKKRIIEEIKNYLANVSLDLSPMEISFGTNEIIQNETGIRDPLKKIKTQANKDAEELTKNVKKIIQESDDIFLSSIKTAIAGNIIDFVYRSDYNLTQTIQDVFNKEPFINYYSLLKQKMQEARNITLLVDNAGEIIFDKILIETINNLFNIESINIVAKKFPFSNDITITEIEKLGFCSMDNIKCTSVNNKTNNNYLEEIKRNISLSDLVISKGQGNFELLYDHDLGIFFLFIVKCKIVADILNANKGDIIISYN